MKELLEKEKHKENALSERTVKTVNLGCRLNIYESVAMQDLALRAGQEKLIIVNSCAVTSQAERQTRQAIRKAHQNYPDHRIVVTGCAAQINPEQFQKMPEIDAIIGNDRKLDPQIWQQDLRGQVLINDIFSVRETAHHLLEGFVDHARAFIQVQNGCDHRCTFCTIPFGRGNARSLPIGEIVNQSRILVQNGVKEIVLSGVDLTSYGGDLPGQPRFGQMVRRLLAQLPELRRLRVSSLDPAEIDADFWQVFARDTRLMPHLHLSVQAGADMILKRMKRRHLRDDVLRVCEQARRLRPDVVFGADIIAGFPTETDTMFDQSYDLVTAADITHLHVFTYSPRAGTPAARMPQLPLSLRKERCKALRTLGERQRITKAGEFIGQELEILMEKPGRGHSPHFFPVHAKTDIPANSCKTVIIRDARDGILWI